MTENTKLKPTIKIKVQEQDTNVPLDPPIPLQPPQKRKSKGKSISRVGRLPQRLGHYVVHYKVQDKFDLLQLHNNPPDNEMLERMNAVLLSYDPNNGSMIVSRSKTVVHMDSGTAKEVYDSYVEHFGDRLLELSVTKDIDDTALRGFSW